MQRQQIQKSCGLCGAGLKHGSPAQEAIFLWDGEERSVLLQLSATAPTTHASSTSRALQKNPALLLKLLRSYNKRKK